VQRPRESDRIRAFGAAFGCSFFSKGGQGRDDTLELGDTGFEVGPAELGEGDWIGRGRSVELRGLHDH